MDNQSEFVAERRRLDRRAVNEAYTKADLLWFDLKALRARVSRGQVYTKQHPRDTRSARFLDHLEGKESDLAEQYEASFKRYATALESYLASVRECRVLGVEEEG